MEKYYLLFDILIKHNEETKELHTACVEYAYSGEVESVDKCENIDTFIDEFEDLFQNNARDSFYEISKEQYEHLYRHIKRCNEAKKNVAETILSCFDAMNKDVDELIKTLKK